MSAVSQQSISAKLLFFYRKMKLLQGDGKTELLVRVCQLKGKTVPIDNSAERSLCVF